MPEQKNDKLTIDKGTGVSIGIFAAILTAIAYFFGLYNGLDKRVTITEQELLYQKQQVNDNAERVRNLEKLATKFFEDYAIVPRDEYNNLKGNAGN